MTTNNDGRGDGTTRRKVLECMTWAGTGLLWTVSGGVPRSLGLIDQRRREAAKGFTFLQISDSHIGFDKPANPNAMGTLEEAIGRIKALPMKPSFMIHTGDITHLSKPAEFDDADKIISQAKLDVHYVPGEHDIIDEEVKLYRDATAAARRATAGTASTPTACISSVWSTSSISRPAAWALSATSSSSGWRTISRAAPRRRPIVLFAHIPLWTVYGPGAGAPPMAPARSLCSSASAR